MPQSIVSSHIISVANGGDEISPDRLRAKVSIKKGTKTAQRSNVTSVLKGSSSMSNLQLPGSSASGLQVR